MNTIPEKPRIVEDHHPRGRTDRPLLVSVLLLTIIGIIVMLSASAGISLDKMGSPSALWVKHMCRVALGLLFLVVFWVVDYHHLRVVSRFVLILAFAMLVWVLWAHRGEPVGRWLNFLGLSFQPSEFARIALVLFLAEALVRKRDRLLEFSGTVPFIIIIATIAILVAKQPNSSMAVLLVLLGGTMLFLGGVRLRYLLGAGAVAIPALLAYMYLVPYQRVRLITFLNPLEDLQGHGYHRLQSLIALGRGGLFGVGPGNGWQKFHFLPEPYKDFIFSILGEEWGLLGTLLVVVLFVVVFWRGMRIARMAPDDFGRLLAAGIVFSLTFNALINIGVTTGWLPITGLPLPFLSYGGTSMLVFMTSAGMLLNISRHLPAREEAGG
jgi:cell division protein FtsW